MRRKGIAAAGNQSIERTNCIDWENFYYPPTAIKVLPAARQAE